VSNNTIDIDEGYFAMMHRHKPKKLASGLWACEGCGITKTSKKSFKYINEMLNVLWHNRQSHNIVFFYKEPKGNQNELNATGLDTKLWNKYLKLKKQNE
jgi:hypothetical protein